MRLGAMIAISLAIAAPTLAAAAPAPPKTSPSQTNAAKLARSIADQLKPFWLSPEDARGGTLVTVLAFDLKPDGSLNGSPRVVSQSGITNANRHLADAHRQAAIRAVELASPFALPAGEYAAWRKISAFRFDQKLALAALQPSPPPILTRPINTQVELPRSKFESQETVYFGSAGYWQLAMDPTVAGGCFGATIFSNDTVLRIQRAPVLNKTLFMLGHTNWRSLREGVSKPLRVVIGDFEPWTVEAGAFSDDGLHWLSFSVDGEFLRELRTSQYMHVSSGKIDLGSFKVADTTAMLQSMANCQAITDTIVDPFAAEDVKEAPMH